jgi:hypothetical protein
MKSPQPVLLFSEASGKKTLIIKQNGFFNCAAGNNRKQTINNRGQTTFKSKDNNRQVEGSSPSRPTIYSPSRRCRLQNNIFLMMMECHLSCGAQA